MGTVRVVVLDVLGKHRLEVTAAEDEHPVEALTPQGTDHTLADGVRPRIVVSGLVGSEILDALDDEVDQLVSAAPPSPGHVGHHFYWSTSAEHQVLFAPLEGADGILAAAGDLVGGDRVEVAFDQAQVTLNIPPYSHRPGRPHIDGYAPGQQTPGTFTLLAGLLLSDQMTDNGGNLWVWPGTHLLHAEYFGASGP